jgi:hypothetical protein
MDVHDDWTDLLERMRHFNGRFRVEPSGVIRHKTLMVRQTVYSREQYGVEWACPLNALCQEVLGVLGETEIEVLENSDFNTMATILDLPQEYVERFACAADGEEVGTDDSSLRQRIIETLC